MPPPPENERTRQSHLLRSASAIFFSAILFSFGPVLVHLTGQDINQFYYNVFIILPIFSISILFLLFTKRRFLDNKLGPKDKFILRQHAFGKQVRWSLVVIAISGFHNACFVWSTKYIETAVAAMIYELWPIFMIYGFARFQPTFKRKWYETHPQEAPSSITTEQIFLILFATVGVIFMLGSQSVDSVLSFDALSFYSYIGISLAFVAAIFGGASAAGSIYYGETLWHDITKIEDPSEIKHELTIWFTMLGLTIARTATTTISLSLGFIISGPQGEFLTWSAVTGAVLVGTTFVIGAILLRVGNLSAPRQTNPAINTLSFLAPALALIWLMLVGVTVPRFDLFIVGAALIMAITILVQLKPDIERDPRKFGKQAKPGTRLGFTAFIMSIWIFGTFLYIRDEVMPSSWVVSSTGEYWGLVALSSTVFTLMLGFRMARLTTRINQEDETMLSLFRNSEHLIRNEILVTDMREHLSDLDTAPSEQLRETYQAVRKSIVSGMENAQTHEDKTMLVTVEQQLDSITHSKQQGRDIVELLSLTAFAAVTIILGLLLRQQGLQLNPLRPSWSGFMSEVFTLLFVSTIAFLCINLFDVRRDRQTTLIIQPSKLDYQLFFRYKRNLRAQHVVAVIISIFMSIVFCGLLAVKWL